MSRFSIPVARPFMGEAEIQAAERVIRSGWVTQGPEVAAFEEEFAAAVGAEHACAVSSCTAALHLALLAVGVSPGDEVITVSSSFIATANAIRHCGAKPVFVDVETESGNIDPEHIEPAISPRTKAILVVHQLGMPCDLAAILPIARQHEIPVIEDAACAIGSEINLDGSWQRIGKPHGDIACFSFHPRKLLCTGDGGMITTANADWDARFRLLRQQGMSIPDTARHTSAQVIFENYPVLGFNYRMTDIQAAIGREQLRRLPQIVARRRELAAAYQTGLAGLADVAGPIEPAFAKINWQSFCVLLGPRLDQKRLMQHLLDVGISTRRGVMCAHLEPAYPAHTWRSVGTLAISERIQDRGLILPLFHEMSDDQHIFVIDQIRRLAVAAAS